MKNLDLSVFPKVDKASWNELAKKQLKGEDPNRVLSWKTLGDLSLSPYYDSSDLQGLEDQIYFFESLPNHAWKLYEEVSVNNEKESNIRAIEALMGGCNGIIFTLEKISNFDELLKDINFEICDLSFITNADLSPSSGCNGMTNENCVFESKKHISAVSQIVELISSSNKEFVYRTSFPDFFLEIAAVRALRYLSNTYLKNPQLKIHTSITSHTQDDHQWFLNTTAGLATILGGSHSISFSASLGDERISRNTGNLIREESGIEEYQDQCGGSYYVEVLTHKLIEETLKKVKL